MVALVSKTPAMLNMGTVVRGEKKERIGPEGMKKREGMLIERLLNA